MILKKSTTNYAGPLSIYWISTMSCGSVAVSITTVQRPITSGLKKPGF